MTSYFEFGKNVAAFTCILVLAWLADSSINCAGACSCVINNEQWELDTQSVKVDGKEIGLTAESLGVEETLLIDSLKNCTIAAQQGGSQTSCTGAIFVGSVSKATKVVP